MQELFTIVSSKGQIVIPASVRAKFGIETGTRISISIENDRLTLQPITKKFIRSMRGRSKDGPSLSEIREREHRLEKERPLR